MENTINNTFKIKEKQLRELLGDYFENTSIDLIQKSRVKDEYYDIGDIVSMNEHYLHHMFQLLEKYNGYIDGWEIPFEDYEIKLIHWMGDTKLRDSIEKQIGEILGLN